MGGFDFFLGWVGVVFELVFLEELEDFGLVVLVLFSMGFDVVGGVVGYDIVGKG